MKNRIKSFLKSRKGMNTVEVVIILAIVVGIAIIFRDQIGAFAAGLMDSIFNDPNAGFSPSGMKNYTPTPTP